MKLLPIVVLLMLCACSTPPVVPQPTLIPETSLVKCDPLPTYTEYTNGSALMKDSLDYTIHLMNIYSDCATGKDTLIQDVRAVQPAVK